MARWFGTTPHKRARYPSGKGEVCKTFMRRFDPGPRLQIPSSILFQVDQQIGLFSAALGVAVFCVRCGELGGKQRSHIEK